MRLPVSAGARAGHHFFFTSSSRIYCAMKKFLIVSTILLIIALLMATAAFFYVSMQLQKSQLSVQSSTAENVPVTNDASATTSEPPEGIPLRDVELSDSQRSVLDTVGVDSETFVITPAMQECAEEKLGTARMQEIIAGGAPTTMETVKLLGCL